MKKQDLINACAVPIAKADTELIASTISDVIDCVMEEYEKKQPTKDEIEGVLSGIGYHLGLELENVYDVDEAVEAIIELLNK